MASGRRLPTLLLLFVLVMFTSTGVTTSRRLNSVKDEVPVPSDFQTQGSIKALGNPRGGLKMEGLLGRRMDIELADYKETGANNDHDPNPPIRA